MLASYNWGKKYSFDVSLFSDIKRKRLKRNIYVWYGPELQVQAFSCASFSRYTWIET